MIDKQLFYVEDYIEGRSKHDKKPYTKIILIDIDTDLQYYTMAYSSMKNYTHWLEVLNNRNRDLIISFDQLVIQNTGKRIINADSKPRIEGNQHKDYFRQHIESLRRRPRTARPDTTFNNLFDIE